jgi:lipopolysaccharide export system permease protein
LGLPLVISRRDRNVFLAAMMCLGVVVLMQLLMIGSSSLGSMRLIKSAALAAWIPVIIFLPWGLAAFQSLKR